MTLIDKILKLLAVLALTAMLPLSSSAFADGAAASYVDPYTGKLAARTIVNFDPNADNGVGLLVAAWIRCFATIRVAEDNAPSELKPVFRDTNCKNMQTLEGEERFINQCISLIDDNGVGWIATGDTQALADAKAAGYCAGKTNCQSIPLFDKNGPEGNISDDTCDGTAAAMDGDVNVTVTSPTDDGDDSQAMELAALFVAARDAIANLGIPPENRAALESRIDALEQSLKNAEATVAELSMSLEEIFQEIQNIPPVIVTPPTVTVTVTTNECDGIVLIDDGNGGCQLHPLVCPAPHRVEGLRCVADTEQNIVMITTTLTVTVTVSALTEGENVVNYGGELITVTTVAGTDEAIGMLASGQGGAEIYLMVVEREPGNTIPTTSVSSGGGSGSNAGLMIGGVAVVGLALWYFTSDSDDLQWTPTYSYRHNNGNVSYSVGSRWTATVNDWRLYWQTRQNGAQFVYGSGMRYNNGIWAAAMNSESESDKTALDLNLSANKTVGLWNLGGGYRFDMELSDDATESQNLLNAKVGYMMDKWILSANANTDGDTATARINYSYRF